MQTYFPTKHAFCAGLILGLFLTVPSTHAAPKAVLIKTTTDKVDQKIGYPQGFSDKKVDEAVQALIKQIQENPCPGNQSIDVTKKGDNQKNNVQNKPSAKESEPPHDLYVDYVIKYQKKAAVSLLFNISTYTKGAAHPCNSVRTLNFVQGKTVQLKELFLSHADFLTPIARISKETLTKKDISTSEWLAEGTKPTEENYSRWYLIDEGLVIVFDTYQVAAYVYGPQTVLIPKHAIHDLLRPDIAHRIWG